MKKVIVLLLSCIGFYQPLSAQMADKDYPYFFQSDPNKTVSTYPIPKISLDSIQRIIREEIAYPVIAKKNRRSFECDIDIQFTSEGKIEKYEVFDFDKDPINDARFLFDSMLKKLMNVQENWWHIRDQSKRAVTLPIHFEIDYDPQGKLYYALSLFRTPLRIVLDSSQTFPPVLVNKPSAKKNHRRLYGDKYSYYSKDYGLVRLGFEVDVNHQVKNLRVVRSVSDSLDKKAMNFFKKDTVHQWFCGRENGQATEGYQEMDVVFYSLLDSNNNFMPSFVPITYTSELKTRTPLGRGRTMVKTTSVRSTLGYQQDISGRTYSPFKDYLMALQEIDAKNYTEAMRYFKLAEKCYFENIQVLYAKMLCALQMDDGNMVCKILEDILYFSSDKGYPDMVHPNELQAISDKSCQ